MPDPQNRERFELPRAERRPRLSLCQENPPGWNHRLPASGPGLLDRAPAWLGLGGWDPATQSCAGRPWNVLPADQGDHPPEGDWVSSKGPKSYVYGLVYVS
ncbi:hypothetical protein BRSPCE3_27940 [Bradyrhizobium sp. Ce-3]|nr:hypothetical protein BRSPCE3_27940 [Bradyrhizobium sp. Ce-3]